MAAEDSTFSATEISAALGPIPNGLTGARALLFVDWGIEKLADTYGVERTFDAWVGRDFRGPFSGVVEAADREQARRRQARLPVDRESLIKEVRQ